MTSKCYVGNMATSQNIAVPTEQVSDVWFHPGMYMETVILSIRFHVYLDFLQSDVISNVVDGLNFFNSSLRCSSPRPPPRPVAPSAAWTASESAAAATTSGSASESGGAA